MNRKLIFNLLGKIIISCSALLLLPFVVSLIYREFNCTLSFGITIILSFIIGVLFTTLFRTTNRVIYAKEGFIIVSLAWISLSVLGALPFTLSGEIGSYVDALFETVSGFTTTGASILTNVEELSNSLLFWRSFTHWIGGMGVLVFVMAIIPTSDRSIHIMKAEMPGPIIGKLVPKAKQTAKILYLIYIALTLLMILLLLAGGMNLLESILHAFGTAGTGGFGIKSDSIASYSPYTQWVITIFMFIFGINFNLFFLILIGQIKNALKSTELWVYTAIVAVATVIITLNISSQFESIFDAVRTSSFNIVSVITTTGYATADFNLWPELSKAVLFTLMFVGGCAGSTAGGLKVSRIVLMFKMIKKEFRHMLQPRSVNSVKFEGKEVDKITQNSVYSYFTLFMMLYFLIFGIICFDAFDFQTNFTAVAACINNIGPGFGIVGPAGSFAPFSDVSKITLSFAMLLGRLEIYPLIFAFSPTLWLKNK